MRKECRVEFVRTQRFGSEFKAQFRGIGASLSDPQCRAWLGEDAIRRRISELRRDRRLVAEERRALHAITARQIVLVAALLGREYLRRTSVWLIAGAGAGAGVVYAITGFF